MRTDVLNRRGWMSWLAVLGLCLVSASASAQLGENYDVFERWEDSNDLAPLSNESRDAILLDEKESTFTYGQYAEVELALGARTFGDVRWRILENTTPPGMELQEDGKGETRLFGTPEFVGQWCFIVSVRSTDPEISTTRQLCVNAQDNDELDHPKFATDRFLPYATVDQRYNTTIEPERFDPDVFGEVIDSGELPEGLEIEYFEDDSEFEVSGTPTAEGSATIVLALTDEGSGKTAFKQFLLNIDEELERGYQCPSGYYFEEELGYCVQNARDLCADGSYYEPVEDACIRYRRPPSGIICSSNSYYDHFLDECVLLGRPRCPYNYRYDGYYGRCVRRAYRCDIGFGFDFGLNFCIRRSHHSRCGRGFHYDGYLNRCVRNYRRCGPGRYWNRAFARCERTRRFCDGNRYYNPRSGRCDFRGDRRFCRGGFRWNGNRCVRRAFNRRCGRGQTWAPRLRRCVNLRRPMPRMPRMMPRPRPPRMMPGMRPLPPRMMPNPRPRPPRMMPGMRPLPPRMMPNPRPRPPRMMPGMRPLPPRMMPNPRPRPPRMMPGMRPLPPRMMPNPRPRPPRMMPNPRPRPPRMMPNPRPRPPRMMPNPRPRPPRMMPNPRPRPPRMMAMPPRPRPMPMRPMGPMRGMRGMRP